VKRLLLVAVLGALVVGATGCDLSPPAATVNGVTISQSTLNAQLTTEINNPDAQCAAQLAAGVTTSPVGVGTESDGTTPNAVTPAFADNALETLVLEQLESQALARHGVTVSPSDVTAATADYEGQLQLQLSQAAQESTTPSGCTLSSSTSVAGQLPKAFLAREGASLADQELFESTVGHVSLSQAALESYYQSHRAEFTELCLNVIVSDTQAAAQTLRDQIAAGASFATASTAAGADQQVSPSGGALPCEYPATATGQFGSALEATINALTTGELAEPLPLATENSTGAATTYYLVLQMRQHELVPLATLRSSIRQLILEAHITVLRTDLQHLVSKADVTVDSRYGGWNAAKGVTVPTPPAPAFVLNAKANVPAPVPTPGLHLNTAPG
jgi:hypothetical protein